MHAAKPENKDQLTTRNRMASILDASSFGSDLKRKEKIDVLDKPIQDPSKIAA
jgi:hypothetical protein